MIIILNLIYNSVLLIIKSLDYIYITIILFIIMLGTYNIIISFNYILY